MRKTTLEIIQERVTQAEGIKTAVIEYNFKLPEHPEVTKDNFFGVEAKFLENVTPGTAMLTYTM